MLKYLRCMLRSRYVQSSTCTAVPLVPPSIHPSTPRSFIHSSPPPLGSSSEPAYDEPISWPAGPSFSQGLGLGLGPGLGTGRTWRLGFGFGLGGVCSANPVGSPVGLLRSSHFHCALPCHDIAQSAFLLRLLLLGGDPFYGNLMRARAEHLSVFSVLSLCLSLTVQYIIDALPTFPALP